MENGVGGTEGLTPILTPIFKVYMVFLRELSPIS